MHSLVIDNFHEIKQHSFVLYKFKAASSYTDQALTSDKQLSPSLQRFILMEWLNRLDTRLVEYIKEKFSTELSVGSNVLVSMVET